MSKAWLENWGSAQDLAQYVAERLPSQAQPSMRSTSAVEHAQPMESADRYDESITDTLAKLVKDILGAKVSVHQPFMEVSVSYVSHPAAKSQVGLINLILEFKAYLQACCLKQA